MLNRHKTNTTSNRLAANVLLPSLFAASFASASDLPTTVGEGPSDSYSQKDTLSPTSVEIHSPALAQQSWRSPLEPRAVVQLLPGGNSKTVELFAVTNGDLGLNPENSVQIIDVCFNPLIELEAAGQHLQLLKQNFPTLPMILAVCVPDEFQNSQGINVKALLGQDGKKDADQNEEEARKQEDAAAFSEFLESQMKLGMKVILLDRDNLEHFAKLSDHREGFVSIVTYLAEPEVARIGIMSEHGLAVTTDNLKRGLTNLQVPKTEPKVAPQNNRDVWDQLRKIPLQREIITDTNQQHKEKT